LPQLTPPETTIASNVGSAVQRRAAAWRGRLLIGCVSLAPALSGCEMLFSEFEEAPAVAPAATTEAKFKCEGGVLKKEGTPSKVCKDVDPTWRCTTVDGVADCAECGDDDVGTCSPGANGAQVYSKCVHGEYVEDDICAESERCDSSAGCMNCVPGETQCDGLELQKCTDAMTWAFEDTCKASLAGAATPFMAECVPKELAQPNDNRSAQCRSCFEGSKICTGTRTFQVCTNGQRDPKQCPLDTLCAGADAECVVPPPAASASASATGAP
jgi:hypothetical protein